MGQRRPVERDPYIVRFTPDGRHALVNGTYAALGYNLTPDAAPRGSVQSIRVGVDGDGPPQHRFVARAQTGSVPEGLDVSPDGRFVVTANLERSTPKPGGPQMARYGSITLIRLDPETGAPKGSIDFLEDRDRSVRPGADRAGQDAPLHTRHPRRALARHGSLGARDRHHSDQDRVSPPVGSDASSPITEQALRSAQPFSGSSVVMASVLVKRGDQSGTSARLRGSAGGTPYAVRRKACVSG